MTPLDYITIVSKLGIPAAVIAVLFFFDYRLLAKLAENEILELEILRELKDSIDRLRMEAARRGRRRRTGRNRHS